MGQNCEWEMQNIKARLERLEQDLEKNKGALHGNGASRGLLTCVALLKERVETVVNWHDEWHGTTNIKEFESMREDVKFLMRWNWLIFGGLAVISVVLQIWGPSITNAISGG